MWRGQLRSLVCSEGLGARTSPVFLESQLFYVYIPAQLRRKEPYENGVGEYGGFLGTLL